jgi:hypothetical protein
MEFNRVFLDQHPLIAAILQRFDELISGIRVIRQRHFGRRKTFHPAQGFQTKDSPKMLLPCGHMKPIILHRRGRRDRMTPRASQPFNGGAILRFAGDALQIVEYVIRPHLTQAVQQRPGVFQHDPRLPAFGDQLRNQFAHPFVAPEKDRRVVIIADSLVIHHVL